MKLGIMTWFHYRNYGTVLQAVALTAKLRMLGTDPFIVNYIPCGHFRSVPDYRFSKILKRFKKKEHVGLNYFNSIEKETRFDSFLNKNLKFTSKCEDLSDLEALNTEFDGFICGSDQVWSPLCFNPHYFLDFVRNPDKKISYAPSFGVNEIEDFYIEKQIKKYLSDFKCISVREGAGKAIIEKLTSKKASVVLDPTLLLTDEEWQNSFDLKKKHTQPYLIAYMLGQEAKHWDEIYRLSEQMNLEVKVIPVYDEDLKRKGCIDSAIGPQEFLELIYNGSYVCTDSFHGIAFSVNFKKQFTAFKRFKKNDPQNQNSRVLHLLKSLDLTQNLYNDKDILPQLNHHIDYNLVELK
ncbi:MAG: polysaccharide pyruvyl transferase family protein, partial [Clostridia bacterium]|nr:polysaccharide pyruvyl transferase family protein [Clostridia bacterium]